MIEDFLSFISGLRYDGKAFYDNIGGKMVYYYLDVRGVRWMKESRFSSFKVKVR